MEINFENTQNRDSIIKVIGVGGGGGNAVNHMFRQGIRGVDFLICNTDAQALEASGIPLKIQLGITLTEGRGAGSIPEVGKNAAIENIDELKEVLKKNTKMIFVTAGLGGGTGTGAAPVIAAAAREMGILTVGIVTIPFHFEGKKRRNYADEGLDLLQKNVDTLLVISNDKLREIYGNLGIREAFAQADNILTTAAKGIAEIITSPGHINTDFADVNTVMRDGGRALMGSGTAEGADRAMRALRDALSSPLLNDNTIKGAKQILVNIAVGEDISLDELGELMDFVQEEAGGDANVHMGTSMDETLGGKVSVTIVATGIDTSIDGNENYTRSIESIGKKETILEINSGTELFNNQSNLSLKFPEESKNENQIGTEFITDSETRPELQIKIISKESENNSALPTDRDEMTRRAKERLQNVKNLSSKIKAPTSFNELEGRPAYERRNIQLNEILPSSATNISRYTLTDNPDEKKIDIRPNNSFLHDNVD